MLRPSFWTSKPNLRTIHRFNCPKDAKNVFFGKLYIDIVIRKKSHFPPIFLKRQIFFRKCHYRKFYQRIFEILKRILTFQKKYFSIFQKLFFQPKTKKLRKFSNHYIDVKFPQEFIFRIFRAV